MAESSFMNKALEAMKKGDKAIKGSFFGNIVNDKKQRAEAAQEHYRNAATNFKLAKSWDLAAQALQRVVDCDQIMGGGDSADILVEAGNMIKKVNSAEAIQYYEKAAEQYFSENRIKNAAKLKKQIGETYEQDLEHTLAIKYYQEAADLYYAEGETTSDYTNLKLKVADLQVSQIDPDYVKAIKIYEEVADKYLENKLTEPSAKNLYFKSILLYIINDDTVGANISINKYIDKSPSFGGTRQQKFLTNLIKAVDENNIEQFSKICYEHNEIIPFDKWQLGILAKIRERVEKLAGSKQLHVEDEDEKPEKKIEDLF